MRLSVCGVGLWICLSLLGSPTLARAVVADAGEDVTAECAGPDGAEVTLDGSGSSPEASLHWSAAGVIFDDPVSISPTGKFPLGTTQVRLTASANGETAEDFVNVTVEDETAPVAHAEAIPDTLWPPNHKLVEVRVRLHVSDACSRDPEVDVELISAESSEPDDGTGDGNTDDDIQDASLGTDDRTVLLRSERSGNGPGRVYTLTYRLVDGSGNQTFVSAEVRVPHDQSDHQGGGGDDGGGPLVEICPLPSEAASEWQDALPDPSDFEGPRTCAAACRNWASGCRKLIGGAKACVASEARARFSLRQAVCMGLPNPEQRDCLRKLQQEKSDLIDSLSEDKATAERRCEQGADQCLDDCELEFEDD